MEILAIVIAVILFLLAGYVSVVSLAFEDGGGFMLAILFLILGVCCINYEKVFNPVNEDEDIEHASTHLQTYEA